MPVKGGFYGEEPSLTDLDNGDLKFTTDFRDIYYELLSRTVGTDPDAVGRRGPHQPGLPMTGQQADTVAGDGQLLVGRNHQHRYR